MNKVKDAVVTKLDIRLTDDVASEDVLEVMYDGVWVLAAPDLWDSWTGLRRRNGSDHHGPVRHLGADTLWQGSRVCPCATCQSGVAPSLRYN